MKSLKYGSIALKSEYCRKCQQNALVIGGQFSCCDRAIDKPATSVKRMSPSARRRRHLTPSEKKSKIEEQNGKCIYCGIPFDQAEFRWGKLAKKEIHFDHIEPHYWQGNQRLDNFAASCSICNLIKSWLVFKDIDEVRAYILEQRRAKGYLTAHTVAK